MPTFTQPGYRWTNQFFRTYLPRVPSTKPKVFGKFTEYSGLREPNLRQAFQWGYIPAVRVLSLPGRYGYTPPTADEIHLGKTFIGELEAAFPAHKVPDGQIYAPSELETKLLWLLEATVLHELVHFFRRKFDETARMNWSSARGRAHEEAWAQEFEKAAYGRLFTVESLLLTRYMPRTAGASK